MRENCFRETLQIIRSTKIARLENLGLYGMLANMELCFNVHFYCAGIGLQICNELERRIMVIDGAMGTMIQRYKFQEEDYRGITKYGTTYIGMTMVSTHYNIENLSFSFSMLLICDLAGCIERYLQKM